MPEQLNRLMLVEDNPDIQELARMSLELVGGFTLTVCSSGGEAVAALADAAPQLILLDVMMPDMDGPETLAAIRAEPGHARTPIVFMTAKVQPAEVERYLALGAIAVVAKPFDPMQLPGEIRILWSRSQS